MLTDPIADLLTRIRNGSAKYMDCVDVPHSNLKEAIARVLEREGYVAGVERVTEGKFPLIRVTLKYGRAREQVIKRIERVSRPGRRVYVRAGEVPVVQNGLGIAILTTSKGLMVDREARRKKLGGEVLCKVV